MGQLSCQVKPETVMWYDDNWKDLQEEVMGCFQGCWGR
ncbi:hypothetical protein AM1_G0172 (plasmid) [Acaryochloris marina MBIC11017]|uniref:Uncharacterized protein n=1 Tax=Acaryochloris marina (strain MBIC 11017) TaxID=329726 RepID=A8ZQR6_ACAM1|nr:hypothetical protein AM1_G0172 [Acaryochloris marina MBIC11017]